MNHITSPCADDSVIEAEIVAKGLTAPRVTLADIEAVIVETHYFTAAEGVEGADNRMVRSHAPDKVVSFPPLQDDPFAVTDRPLNLLTFCVLVLRNGFTVTGEAACASPENFDADIGRKVARANAVGKIWPLLGYALKQKLHEGT